MTNAPAETPRESHHNWWKVLLLALLVLFLTAAAWVALSVTRTEFPLAEVPVLTDLRGEPVFSGQEAVCSMTPSGAVRKYPQFVSSAPLFGEIDLDSNGSGGAALVAYHFAIDESKGAGTGYDTLYFDTNSNFDLTDDVPRVATDRTPNVRKTCFEHITLPWNYGPAVGQRPLGFEPRLLLRQPPNYHLLCFQYLCARQGRIRLGRHSCVVTLVRGHGASGRYDENDTWVQALRPMQILLFKHGRIVDIRRPQPKTFGLKEMMHLGNKWCRLLTTPLGDKLVVKPYDGDTGILQTGAAGRPVAVRMSSLWWSRDTGGRFSTDADESSPSYNYVERAELPVGDYALEYCELEVGPIYVDIRGNTNSDGVPDDGKNHPLRYFVEIRKDRPFTFELPKTLDVLFANPARDAHLKPGDTLSVKAGLVDPVHDLTVTSMRDSRRKVSIGRASPSAPVTADVEIRDSSANPVARGTLDVYNLLYKGFQWRVPDTFQPKDGRERLTIVVTCDTLEAFGKIEASREIIIEKPEGQ